MKKRTALLLLALAVFMPRPGRAEEKPGAAAAQASAAALWEKALEIFRKNSDWYPEKIVILSEVLNRRDRLDSVTQLFFSMRMDAAGRMHTELTRALKNGEDVSEKMKKKVEIRGPHEAQAPGKQDSLNISLSDSPFNPDRQRNVSLRPDPGRGVLFGHRCRRFDFTYFTEITRNGKVEKLTWTGMAWLDESSGMPVKLEFSLAPLPKRIHSLWTVYSYDAAQPDRWLLKQITITGHGGFLFIKKKFRSTTAFSDYRRQPKRGNEK